MPKLADKAAKVAGSLPPAAVIAATSVEKIPIAIEAGEPVAVHALPASEVECTAASADERIEIAVEPADVVDTSGSAGSGSPGFGFAGRLAAVSRLNGPSSRSARRAGAVAPAGRAVPLVKPVEVKCLKDKRLPTAVAFRPTRKAKHSAEIIDLAAVRGQSQRGHSRSRGIRRAA